MFNHGFRGSELRSRPIPSHPRPSRFHPRLKPCLGSARNWRDQPRTGVFNRGFRGSSRIGIPVRPNPLPSAAIQVPSAVKSSGLGGSRGNGIRGEMAEGEGFEPPVAFRLRLISSQVPLTTQPPFLCLLTSALLSPHGCIPPSIDATTPHPIQSPKARKALRKLLSGVQHQRTISPESGWAASLFEVVVVRISNLPPPPRGDWRRPKRAAGHGDDLSTSLAPGSRGSEMLTWEPILLSTDRPEA